TRYWNAKALPFAFGA
nr:Chain C, 30S ribosomal protein S2 [Escherichia coli K-12]7OXG_D Chain D, 30S ribosomal protein S2 [Escherichia coli K-12]7OXJ_D Chain D, 30S ribosomal protein S2 [Escherichia coli K-12]